MKGLTTDQNSAPLKWGHNFDRRLVAMEVAMNDRYRSSIGSFIAHLGSDQLKIQKRPEKFAFADSKGFTRLDYSLSLAYGRVELIFSRKPSENRNFHLNLLLITTLYYLLSNRPTANRLQLLETLWLPCQNARKTLRTTFLTVVEAQGLISLWRGVVVGLIRLQASKPEVREEVRDHRRRGTRLGTR